MSETVIVPMTPEHLDGVMVVELESFSIPWIRGAFEEEITRNKFAVYYTALTDGVVSGYIGVWKMFDEGHITNIAVGKAFRRMGIGKLLIARMFEDLEAAGVGAFTLEVRKSNLPAQNLYTAFGFQTAGMRKGYYADNGEDALIMWRHKPE